MFHVKLVTPEGEIEAPPSSVRLAVDWMNVHFPTKTSGEGMSPGRRNAVYADGHAAASGG